MTADLQLRSMPTLRERPLRNRHSRHPRNRAYESASLSSEWCSDRSSEFAPCEGEERDVAG